MSNVVNVGISIQNVSLTQQGFGTPIFICNHGFSNNRVIEVSSVNELLDMGFPADHGAVKAATEFFSQTPSISTLKIGMIWGTIPVTINELEATPKTFTINVLNTDGSLRASVGISASTETHTPNELALELSEALDNASISINVTAIGSQINIKAEEGTRPFRVTTNDNLTVGAAIDLENGTEALNQIIEEDDDFYFVTCEPRIFRGTGTQFCLQLAAAIETMDKMFFTSSSIIDDMNLSENSPFLTIIENKYTKTVLIYHQNANDASEDRAFPECTYVGFNAAFQAGSVTWSNLVINLPVSVGAGTDRQLTSTQKALLAANNIAYVELDNGVNVLKGGKVASGEWIDVIRGVAWLKSDFTTSLKSLLFSQKGGKVPYTNVGIGRVREVCQSSLQRAVNRGFLDSYTLTVPLINQLNPTDWQNRVLNGIRFTGILSGAIHSVNVLGSVTSPSNQ